MPQVDVSVSDSPLVEYSRDINYDSAAESPPPAGGIRRDTQDIGFEMMSYGSTHSEVARNATMEIAKRDEMIVKAKEAIKQLKSVVAEKDIIIGRLEEVTAAKDARIVQLENGLRTLSQKASPEVIAAKDERIEDLERTVASMSEGTQNLAAVTQEKDELSEQMAERDALIAKMTSSMEEWEQNIDELQHENNRLQEENEALENEHAEMARSLEIVQTEKREIEAQLQSAQSYGKVGGEQDTRVGRTSGHATPSGQSSSSNMDAFIREVQEGNIDTIEDAKLGARSRRGTTGTVQSDGDALMRYLEPNTGGRPSIGMPGSAADRSEVVSVGARQPAVAVADHEALKEELEETKKRMRKVEKAAKKYKKQGEETQMNYLHKCSEARDANAELDELRERVLRDYAANREQLKLINDKFSTANDPNFPGTNNQAQAQFVENIQAVMKRIRKKLNRVQDDAVKGRGTKAVKTANLWAIGESVSNEDMSEMDMFQKVLSCSDKGQTKLLRRIRKWHAAFEEKEIYDAFVTELGALLRGGGVVGYVAQSVSTPGGVQALAEILRGVQTLVEERNKNSVFSTTRESTPFNIVSGMVDTFQKMFDITSLDDVLPRLHELNLFITECDTFIRAARKHLSLDDNAKFSECLGAIKELAVRNVITSGENTTDGKGEYDDAMITDLKNIFGVEEHSALSKKLNDLAQIVGADE